MTVPPARVSEAPTAAQKAAESNSLPWAALARGLGIIYFALLPGAQDDETRMRIESATNAMHDACGKLGRPVDDSVVPDSLEDSSKSGGSTTPSFPQMQKIKTVFDPQGVLSPGRFVGGL